jgi:hypothetical protein
MTVPNVQPVYFIAWEKNSHFDNTINGMKAKAFQFINSLLQKKEKVIDNGLVEGYTGLIRACLQNLEFVVSQKFSYLQEMDKESLDFPDYNYENLLYQVLLFLSRILIREPFVDNFKAHDRKYIFI